MKKLLKRFFVVLLATVTVLTCMVGDTYAEENARGVVKSIFSPDNTLESTTTIGRDKPTQAVETVGELEVEVGQTITDAGLINKFKTSEAVAGDLEYGVVDFSTSIVGAVVDGTFYDVQNDVTKLDRMIEYVTEDVQSTVSVNYDIKNQTGGKEIKYSFTGKKSTGDNYVYAYFHYYVHGKAANGQKITRGGYLGYKIKVKPAKGGLIYDANGGTIRGQATFDDKAGRVAPDPSDTGYFPQVNIDIISDVPVREGYKFAFWQNEKYYKDDGEVYSDQSLDQKAYPVGENKSLTKYKMTLNFRQSRTETLKAVWDKEYSLKYDVDGKTNVVNEEKGLLGLNLNDLSIKSKDIEVAAGVKKAEGGEFKCWRDGTTDYAPGSTITLTENKSDVTLKAIWNITTEYVDKDGHAIKDSVISEEKKPKDIAGYKFLKEEPTANGVKYIYENINAPQPDPNPQPQPDPNPQPEPQPEPKENHNWGYMPYWYSYSYSNYPFFTSVSKKDEDKKEVKSNKEEKAKVVIEDYNAYIFGYPDNTVRPNNTLTRAEAVAMVTRLSKLDLSDNSRASYADLKDKAWYLSNVNAGLKAGMLDADQNGNLRPNESVTRGEFAKMIAAIDKAGEGKAPFKDIVGHKYEKEINQLYSNKRIFGYADGSFKPDGFLTRAEAAAILNRVFNRVTDAEALMGFEDKIHNFIDLYKNDWYYYEMVEATNHHESETRGEKDSMNRDLEKWTKVLNNK